MFKDYFLYKTILFFIFTISSLHTAILFSMSRRNDTVAFDVHQENRLEIDSVTFPGDSIELACLLTFTCGKMYLVSSSLPVFRGNKHLELTHA